MRKIAKLTLEKQNKTVFRYFTENSHYMENHNSKQFPIDSVKRACLVTAPNYPQCRAITDYSDIQAHPRKRLRISCSQICFTNSVYPAELQSERVLLRPRKKAIPVIVSDGRIALYPDFQMSNVKPQRQCPREQGVSVNKKHLLIMTNSFLAICPVTLSERCGVGNGTWFGETI